MASLMTDNLYRSAVPSTFWDSRSSRTGPWKSKLRNVMELPRRQSPASPSLWLCRLRILCLVDFGNGAMHCNSRARSEADSGWLGV